MKKLIVIFFITYSYCLPAQNWQTLGSGLNGFVGTIYADSINNVIYVTGNFTVAGGIPVNNEAKWNGIAWDTVEGSGYNVEVFPIGRYNGELYATITNNQGSTTINTFTKWNGTSWADIATVYISQMIVYNNEMYVFGSFSSINGVSAYNVAKWDGTNWSGIGGNVWEPSSGVFSAVFYNGELYVACYIDFGSGNENIAKWDGSNWVSVGGGIIGNLTNIDELKVYNNELYAAGDFTTANGNVGNYIQKWNGSAWSGVGGGCDDYVDGMSVYNNKLYVGGAFWNAGGIPAHYIASWDGVNWCAGPKPGDPVSAFGVLNDSMYVGINSDDTINLNFIARFTGGSFNDTCTRNVLGGEELKENETISLYPNPTTSSFTISTTGSKIKEVRVFDVVGSLVISHLSLGNTQETIDMSGVAKGIYFVQIMDEKLNVVNKKVVVQ